MVFLELAELLIVVLIILFFIFEVVVPLYRGTPMFSLGGRKGKQLEKEIKQARQRLQIAELEKEVAELQKQLGEGNGADKLSVEPTTKKEGEKNES